MCFAAYLATDWRLDPVAKNACFAFSGQFFKTFSVFPRVSVTIHCLPQNISLKHSVSLLKKLPFLHHVFFKHQEKGMVFSISLHCSWFELYFLDLWDTTVFFEIICSNMSLLKMLGIWVWGFLCFTLNVMLGLSECMRLLLHSYHVLVFYVYWLFY